MGGDRHRIEITPQEQSRFGSQPQLVNPVNALIFEDLDLVSLDTEFLVRHDRDRIEFDRLGVCNPRSNYHLGFNVELSLLTKI